MKRRAFLKAGALALPGLAMGPLRGAVEAAPGPLKRRGVPHTVIVVGAGLAGLAAAYELKQAGHRVRVLEAQMRPGGRVESLRAPFSDGLHTETGAVFTLSTHRHTMDYIRRFDLPLYAFKPGDLRVIFYLAGQRYEATYDEAVAWPFDLTPEERELGFFGMQAQYMAPIFEGLGDVSDPAWPPESLRHYDDMDFATFLRKQGASPGAIALLRMGFKDTWGEGLETVSALFLMRVIAVHLDTLDIYTLEQGNDRLPYAFAARLAQDIRYGAPVVRIEHHAEGVRVVFQQAGRPHTVEGDYLVCTVPFSVLRHIEVSPPFSAPKRAVVEQLPYTSVARVYLQFKERLWTDGPGAWGATDLPMMNINDATFDQQGPRGILASFAAGAEARRIAAMSEAERIRTTLAQVEQVFPGISAAFEGGTSKCWDEDPWARGAYCWFKPGQMQALSAHLSTPEGRIYFAGEHTSAWNGFMQGALESGVRVAHAINNIS